MRKIWSDVTGMVVICTSHSSIQTPIAVTKVNSFSTASVQSRRHSNTGSGGGADLYAKRKVEGNDSINFKEAFDNSPQALHIDLFTIDIVSTTEVIQRLFIENTSLKNTIKTHGLNIDVDDDKFTFNANIAEDFYQLVHDLSGGNVLYIIELVKVAIDNAKLLLTNNLRQEKPLQIENSSKIDTSVASVATTISAPPPTLPTFDSSLLQSFPAHTRVDEVISYRFDLLDNAAQLILKVAAAICCNGHYCNYHILCYIIYYYTYHMEIEAVPKNSYFYHLMCDKSRQQTDSHQSNVAHSYHHTNKSILDITRSSPQSLLRLFSTTFKTIDVLKVLKHLVTSHEFIYIATHKLSLDFIFHHQQMEIMKGNGLDNIYFFPVMDSSSSVGGQESQMSNLGLYDACDSYDFDSDDDKDADVQDNTVREARLTSHFDINQLVLLDNTILKHISYDFMARLEMQNIYNLMLEEQKIELHLAIANYFNFVFNIQVHHFYSTTIPRSLSSNVSSRQNVYCWLSLPCIQSSDVLEQSFHYRKGMAHNSVVVSLYYYASFLTSINASSKAYEEYHSAYLKIVDLVDNYRQLGSCDFDFLEVEGNEEDEESEDDSEQSDAASHISRNSLGSRASRNELQEKLFALRSPVHNASAFEKHIHKKWFKLTKLDLFRLCNYGDSSMLEVYILAVIRLAQCLFSLYYDVNMAVLLYEQAFHLILLTCRDRKVNILGKLRSTFSVAPDEGINIVPTVESSAVEVKSLSVHHRGLKSGITTSDGIEYEDYEAFGMSDFSLLFPIISGMVMMYRLGYFSNDLESLTVTGYKQNKEYKVIELYLTLAQSNPSYLPYSILGNCLLHNYFLHLHTNKAAKKARNLSVKIMESYDLTGHNPIILQLYAFDIVPQTIAMQFVYMVWLQMPDLTQKMLPYLIFLMPRIEQYNTLAAALLPLCIGLNCLGQCRHSFELYDTTYYAKELHYEPTYTKKLSTLFNDYKQYLHLYLMLMSKYEEIQVLCHHIKGDVSQQQMADKRSSAAYINNINHMNRIEVFLDIFTLPNILQHELMVDFMKSFQDTQLSIALLECVLINTPDSPFMTLSKLEQQHQGQHSQEGSAAVSATRPLTHAGCDHTGASREYVVAASLYLSAIFSLLSFRYKQAKGEEKNRPESIVAALQRALDYVRYTRHITQPNFKTYLYSFMMALMLEINVLSFLLYLHEHFPDTISADSAALYQEVRAVSLHLYRKTLDGLEITFPLLEEIYIYHM
ncbi:hypothetical protein EON65_04420 [archaeon]|nr:MAG: hypothetical protein EON65_04420 [archaeon]